MWKIIFKESHFENENLHLCSLSNCDLARYYGAGLYAKKQTLPTGIEKNKSIPNEII